MGLGIVVVEVCDSNLMSALELEDLEEEYPEVAVLRTECLSLCGLCKIRPYALVNAKRVFATTSEECIKLIKQRIEEELLAFEI
ncbi:uncharacterized protein YuzB (UPF0349 family) [Paenibacillus anaericanus]|uniref:DUF1450 domain-containing protein n=1 Tax=Paenibacillus anaericanus TaxID=170367 RepID=A0A433YDE0_9BACL|nr:DUF1450 domain-containing protein [Paenibacillus anaericanus]MDQ0088355.1 uncharacterized protein YuzB (UPF0349 family) [Paenibacillus anaericanus]RUT47888.1 DUF1450 domain-containing protein [Paenibacillus anaericanus]